MRPLVTIIVALLLATLGSNAVRAADPPEKLTEKIRNTFNLRQRKPTAEEIRKGLQGLIESKEPFPWHGFNEGRAISVQPLYRSQCTMTFTDSDGTSRQKVCKGSTKPIGYLWKIGFDVQGPDDSGDAYIQLADLSGEDAFVYYDRHRPIMANVTIGPAYAILVDERKTNPLDRQPITVKVNGKAVQAWVCPEHSLPHRWIDPHENAPPARSLPTPPAPPKPQT